MDDLIALLRSYGLPDGLATSLETKLLHARDTLTDSCDNLASFVSQVEAQSGKKLTEAQAVQLLAGATQIMAVLGC